MNLTFISAGAGSGKTHTLTQTLSQLLNDGTVRPSGVIATTFTKKAASELRERVRLSLLEAGEFQRANAMGQALIGTVNSVCGSLLTRFAFAAGLPTQQQVIEEDQTRQLIKEAIDAALSGPEVAQLAQVANRLGIEDWSDIVEQLVMQTRANDIDPILLPTFAQRNADELLQHFPPASRRDLTGELLAAITAALPPLRAAAAASTVKKTENALYALESFQRALQNGTVPWSDWIKLGKDGIPENSLIPLTEPVLLIAQNYAEHRQLQADLRDYLTRIFALCSASLDHYRQRKLELGIIDFTDQEHLLLKLLDRPDVADVLSEELDLLLVDEFQDTSPIQLALFLKLSRFAKATYWVGDIKQAIYGFRGSDTALMQSILQALPQLGGRKKVLDRSWRSRPALVHLVNAVFSHTFSSILPSEEITLSPVRPETLDAPALANWFLEGKNLDQSSAALAEGVRQLLQSGQTVTDKSSGQTRPLQARDVAILCYTHTAISRIASSLRLLSIPVATSQPGLLATPEATLALACLRRLNDARDTIATAEILSLADSAEPEQWLSDRLHYLYQQNNQSDRNHWRESGDNAHPLLACIATLRQELPLLSPSEALHRIIAAGQLASRVLVWQQDSGRARTRLGNLEALLELAAQYEDSCRNRRQAATLSGLLLWFQEQADNDQDAQAEPAIDAVRVLTHHAAKGLEWPVVILCDLDKTLSDKLWGISATTTTVVDALNPLANRFLRYWPWPFGKQQSGIDLKVEIEKTDLAQSCRSAAEAEARRLLYVSFTRPRDLLILARKGLPESEKALNEPWLKTLDADWLTPAEQSTKLLRLPDGGTIPYQQQICRVPETAMPATAQSPRPLPMPLHDFPPLPALDRQKLFCTPSVTTASNARIGQSIGIGERIKVHGQPAWDVLGTALHACLAVSFTDPMQPLGVAHIERLLQNHGVGVHLDPSEVLQQISAFHLWINQRWPGSKAMAEVPVQTRLTNGQILNGRIDLLLATELGYILIDHKTSPLGESGWQKLAQTYSSQLDHYARAITAASGQAVREQWLFLPVVGQAFSIDELSHR